MALALTANFREFERYGLVLQPDDKDAALLPRRIDGNFAMLHRPMHDTGSHIWMSYSRNLRNWGGHKLVLRARRGAWWGANKIGLSPPLIETPRSWLMLYHGVRHDLWAGRRHGVPVLWGGRHQPGPGHGEPPAAAPVARRARQRGRGGGARGRAVSGAYATVGGSSTISSQ